MIQKKSLAILQQEAHSVLISSLQSNNQQSHIYLELGLIIRYVLGITEVEYMSAPEIIVSEKHHSQVLSLVHQRAEGMPLAYILGYKEFYGKKFYINPSVLIPRPETELLVDLALHFIYQLTFHKNLTDYQSTFLSHNEFHHIPNTLLSHIPHYILDCGTGSGCIGISIMHELIQNSSQSPSPHNTWHCTLSDVSSKALQIAEKNKNALIPQSHIDIVQSDLLSSLPKNTYGIIIANLPYVASHHLRMLNLTHEPLSALEGTRESIPTHSEGLEIIEMLFKQLSASTHHHILMLEIDPIQIDSINALATNYCYHLHGMIRDLSHYPRVFYYIK